MANILWDRLLETCYRRNAELAMIVPGSPPLLWMDHCWRALQVKAASERDVIDMANEHPGPKPEWQSDGYAYSDFWYGMEAYFRAMAFGFPNTRLLLVTRMVPPQPPPANPRITSTDN